MNPTKKNGCFMEGGERGKGLLTKNSAPKIITQKGGGKRRPPSDCNYTWARRRRKRGKGGDGGEGVNSLRAEINARKKRKVLGGGNEELIA